MENKREVNMLKNAKCETLEFQDLSCSEEDSEDYEYENKKIAELIQSVPLLKDLFKVHGKIGEGTFSSVFLATLKSSDGLKKFAVKHLVPTCHPDRIEQELQCLQKIGGTDHVAGLELCLRSTGSIIFVMPYMKHDRFSQYVHNMSVQETKDYMRALLTALKRVHKFNIIHRDIKPSNFLYDRKNRRYLLVDFGLAQQYTEETKLSIDNKAQILSNCSVKRKRSDENRVEKVRETTKKAAETKCMCFGKARICSVCLIKPPQVASRAGTPGFRAPEVLLKYPYQTPAIDIWASGVMMLCILSGTQLFFRSPDDCTALSEITSIFGSARMQQCARKLGRKLVFSENIPGIDIVSLCQKLRNRNKACQAVNALNDLNKGASGHLVYPMTAYDLLIRLLDPDFKTRATAEQALNHPFLQTS